MIVAHCSVDLLLLDFVCFITSKCKTLKRFSRRGLSAGYRLPRQDERAIQPTLRALPTAPAVRATSVDLPSIHQPHVAEDVQLRFPGRPLPQMQAPASVEPQSLFPLDEAHPDGTPSVRMPGSHAGPASMVSGAQEVAPEVQLVWSNAHLRNGHFRKHKHEFADLGITNVNDFHTLAQRFFARPLGGSVEEFINVDRERIYRWDPSTGLLGCLELPGEAGMASSRLASLFRPKFDVGVDKRKEAAKNYVDALRP